MRLKSTCWILLCVLLTACDSGTEPDPVPAVDRIVVEPSSFVLEVGDALNFIATPQDAAGRPVTGHTVVWSSSDEAVATVSASGTVTGTGRGAVTITAAASGRTGTSSGEIEPSMTITEAGGTLTSADGRVTLVFPAGAVSEPVRISIEPSTGLPADPRLVAGSAYRFGPSGLQFSVPVQVTIDYGAASALPAGAGRYLALHRWTDDRWQAAAPITADTLAGTVSGSLSGFSNYGAALSEFMESLQELSATLDRVLGDPVVHDALTLINLVAGLAAASDNPLYQALVEPALEAARVTTCNAYAGAIDQAMAATVSSYEAFTTQTGRVMLWHGIVAKLPDAGNCAPPVSFDQVIAELVTEFADFTIARLAANDLATDYPKLLAEARLVLKLRTDAASLTLFDLDQRLLNDAQQPLMERLRTSAYAECRARRDHVHLGDLLETMSLLDQTTYEASDVLLDLQYCGTDVDWSIEKPDGTQISNGTLGGGAQPGAQVTTAQASGLAEGTLRLSNTLLAFRCRGGTFEQDVVTVLLDGTEVQTLPFNSGGNFLMQSEALDLAAMLQTAGIDPAESATHQLTLTRASAGCGNSYVTGPEPVTLATLDLQYPAPVEVTISPDEVTLEVGQSQSFTATVTGADDTDVTWSAGGGDISQNGFYTALVDGTHKVRATSKADPNVWAEAQVTVVQPEIEGEFRGTYIDASTCIDPGEGEHPITIWLYDHMPLTNAIRVAVRYADGGSIGNAHDFFEGTIANGSLLAYGKDDPDDYEIQATLNGSSLTGRVFEHCGDGTADIWEFTTTRVN